MNNQKRNLTIEDIAKELGLSKTTISRAISGKGRISEKTVQRVREYIELHNYRPNVAAKGLAVKKTFNLGVVIPADSNVSQIPFFQECLMGVCEAASNLDYDVVVVTVSEDDISYLKRIVQNKKVDGIVLTRNLVNDKAALYLREINIPFVEIGSTDSSVVQIDTDHVKGCTELTSILLMSGNSRVAYIAGDGRHVVSNLRYRGFCNAFAARDIAIDENLIFQDVVTDMQIDTAVDRAIERRAECIICADDRICGRALNRIHEKDYLIPNDIKVASFYNSLYLETHNPPITSIKINVKELGETAALMLINMIAGAEVEQKTLLDYEIVLKKSTM